MENDQVHKMSGFKETSPNKMPSRCYLGDPVQVEWGEGQVAWNTGCCVPYSIFLTFRWGQILRYILCHDSLGFFNLKYFHSPTQITFLKKKQTETSVWRFQRWLMGLEHVLLFQRTWVEFLVGSSQPYLYIHPQGIWWYLLISVDICAHVWLYPRVDIHAYMHN